MDNQIQLRNIKLSLLLKKKIALKPWQRFMIKSNIVIKIKSKFGNLRLTIYPNNAKHINLTGLKSLSYLTHITNTIQNHFKCTIVKIKIDNIFYSVKNRKRIKLSKLYNYLKRLKKSYVNFNPESFAGIQIKSKEDKYVILLFSTASVCILGRLTPLLAQHKYNALIQLIKVI